MLEDREIRKEALVIVATFYFTILSQKLDLFNTIYNSLSHFITSDIPLVSGAISAVILVIAIPLILFAVSYMVIIFLDGIIEWAKRNIPKP